jgi:hypothetical protein
MPSGHAAARTASGRPLLDRHARDLLEDRDEAAEETPRPARSRGRRARPADDEGDEALEAVS